MDSSITKQLVKKILENASSYKWSLQGLGMLRLYLSEEVRLHVWDSEFSAPGASTMHTHPWDFESLIVAGVLNNIRYTENRYGDLFNTTIIKCGEGGCIVAATEQIKLLASNTEIYFEGSRYTQYAEEIHESFPVRGTVTIVKRVFKEDRDHARVFWKYNEEWGSAEPRTATTEEVNQITNHCLQRWF